jgi:hypothetical protein
MARFLIFKSTMEIVHVSPATIFHVRQALTVEGQLALVLLNALNYGHGRNLLLLAIIQDRDDEGRQSRRANFRLTHYQMPGHFRVARRMRRLMTRLARPV